MEYSSESLFHLQYQKSELNSNLLALETPLGKIVLDLEFDSLKISETKPYQEGIISKNIGFNAWQSLPAIVELVKIDLDQKLPHGMSVDRTIAYIFRLRAKKKICPRFFCRLMFDKQKLEPNPESGEGLIAQSWTNEKFILTIGTEDEDLISSRTEIGMEIPRGFRSKKLSNDLFEYLDDGIEIRLPEIFENETVQIQFVVSWTNIKNNPPCSTWFAVDVKPKQLLNDLHRSSIWFLPKATAVAYHFEEYVLSKYKEALEEHERMYPEIETRLVRPSPMEDPKLLALMA